ncbi:MAG: hypothetical protein ACK5HP_00175 [Bacilli bacterium]
MSKTVISKSNIIEINEFMEKYVGVKYEGSDKLTHGLMFYFLTSKGYICPAKGIFKNIKKDEYLTYKYLIVIDENNQKIPYLNPKYHENINFNDILKNNNINQLREIRTKTLEQMGYKYDKFGDSVIENDCVNISLFCEQENEIENDDQIESNLENEHTFINRVNRMNKLKVYGTRASHRKYKI